MKDILDLVRDIQNAHSEISEIKKKKKKSIQYSVYIGYGQWRAKIYVRYQPEGNPLHSLSFVDIHLEGIRIKQKLLKIS